MHKEAIKQTANIKNQYGEVRYKDQSPSYL